MSGCKTPAGALEAVPSSGLGLAAGPEQLLEELNRTRIQRDQLLDRERRIMELLGTTAPERLLHDLRNLLNERALFKALADKFD